MLCTGVPMIRPAPTIRDVDVVLFVDALPNVEIEAALQESTRFLFAGVSLALVKTHVRGSSSNLSAVESGLEETALLKLSRATSIVVIAGGNLTLCRRLPR